MPNPASKKNKQTNTKYVGCIMKATEIISQLLKEKFKTREIRVIGNTILNFEEDVDY